MHEHLGRRIAGAAIASLILTSSLVALGNITNDNERGLGGWSVADIAAYLKNGHNPTTASTGIMGEGITLSSSQMTTPISRPSPPTSKTCRVRRLRRRLRSPPPNRKWLQGAPSMPTNVRYATAWTGGVPYLFPSLAGSPNVRSADPTSLIRVLIEGARSVATAGEPTGPGMPSFAWKLSDDQAAAVLTYIRNSWGASAPAVDPGQVEQARARASMASTGR